MSNHSNIPAWVEAANREAYERAARIKKSNQAALDLSDYQQAPVDFCRDKLGMSLITDDIANLMNSVRDNPVTIARSANAVGKAQPVETKIPTPRGWVEIGNLRVGDFVFTQSGKKTRVIGVHKRGLQPTYRVKFNDDSETLAAADHLWNVRTSSGQYRARKYKTITTDQMIDWVDRHTHIPMCAPVEYEEANLPIDPYTLGVLIGDGSLTSEMVSFTSADIEIVERVSGFLSSGLKTNKLSNKYAYSISRGNTGYHKENEINSALVSIGLKGKKSQDKFIPTLYLQAGIEQRKELLRGLMDTDGYICTNHSISFSTTSRRLAVDIRELIQSLGGTAKIRQKLTHYKNKDGKKVPGLVAYNVYIKIPFCPFHLTRKAARYVDETLLQKQAHRLIDAVEYVGMMESVCITVEDESGLYLTSDFIVTHNSYSAGRIGLWFYLAHPDSQVYLAAAPPERNLVSILWAQVAMVVRNKPAMVVGHNFKRLRITRSPDSFIEGVTIPLQGTSEERQAKFCADAEDEFELYSGKVVRYKDMIGLNAVVVSVNEDFETSTEPDAEFFDNGLDDVYEITLASGLKIRRTGKHPLYAASRGISHKKSKSHEKGRFDVFGDSWTPVDEISPGDVVLAPENTSFAFGVEAMDSNEVKVLAYLIGDGSITKRILFIQKKNAQLNEFIACATALGSAVSVFKEEDYSYVVAGDGSGEVGSNPVLNLVKDHGIYGCHSDDKFIPDAIFEASKRTVALFLNRLFSTDGWACMCKCGKYQKAEIGYVSKSERLVKDIQRLLFRFGIRSLVRSTKKSWTHKGVKKFDVYWNLTIGRSEDIIKFAEEIGIFGKEEQVEKCLNYAKSRNINAAYRQSVYPGFVWEKVKSVEYIGKRPTVGVYVPKNHTYLTNLVEHNSGKHAPHLMFIVDEGDAVPEEVYKGIESCMSSGHVRLLILFNPRAPQGLIYDMEMSARANVVELSAFDHPNVLTGMDVIPGAVSREVTVRRINEWSRPLGRDEKPNDECFEVPEFLVGSTATSNSGIVYQPLPSGYRKVTQEELWYMTLAKYPNKGVQQLISVDWINAALERGREYKAKYGEVPPPGVQPVLGLDCAEFGGDNNSLCVRYNNYIAPIRTWGGLDTDETTDKALDIFLELNADRIYVDALGVGSAVAPAITRRGRYEKNPPVDVAAIGVKVSEKPSKMTYSELGEFYSIRDEIWWRLREHLRLDPNAMLPDDPMLAEELRAATYEYTPKGDKIKVMSKEEFRKKLKRSPDRADALCLTFAPLYKASVVGLTDRF